MDLKAYVAITRPFTLLPPFLGIVSGAFAAVGSEAVQGDAGELLLQTWWLILLGGIMASLLNAASNVLNQVTEVELDRKNKPQRVLPQGRMPLDTATAYAFLLYALALALAWVLSPEEGIHHTFWCAAAAAVATILYSAKPVYAKARGWWANITIAIPRGCLLKVAGWGCVASVTDTLEPWAIGLVFMLFLLGAASTKDFSDLEGDRQAGIQTLPVRLGIEKTARLISPFFILPWILLAAMAVLPTLYTGKPLLTANPGAILLLSVLLAGYGLFIAGLMWKRPTEFSTDGNHVSWVHMYRMMMFAQIGLVACYFV